MPWDTEDRIILTVEIHEIWDSDQISEWKAMDIGTLLKLGVEYSLLAYVMFYRVVIFLGRFLAPIFNHI